MKIMQEEDFVSLQSVCKPGTSDLDLVTFPLSNMHPIISYITYIG